MIVHHCVLQHTYYDEGADLRAVALRAAKSTLTAFYKCNRDNPAANSVLYHDFPSKFVYDETRSKWTPRSQSSVPAVGRMYMVSPKDPERFYLRVMLCHVAGATCEGDLLMVQVRFLHCPLAVPAYTHVGLIMHELFTPCCMYCYTIQDHAAILS